MDIIDHEIKSYLRTIEINGYNLQQINELMDAGKFGSFDRFVNEAISAYLLRVNNFYELYKRAKDEKKEKPENCNLDAKGINAQLWKNQEELRIDLKRYIHKYPDVLKPFEEKLGNKITNVEKFIYYCIPIAWEELQEEEAVKEKDIQEEWSNLPDYKNYL